MDVRRLTLAQALVQWLIAQRTELNGRHVPLFPGVFAIFGHGNVTCLGEALVDVQDELPTWRGQNEQGMAMAAIAFAKARRRRQIMVATSSVGPGATNMVTAAGVAMANRLPVLLLAGDTFVSRLPDPVLQQVEHFGDPSRTVNDCFRPVTRYWDRLTRPEQLLRSLPLAVSTMLDPATCGPAFLGLPQDVQAEAFDFPAAFFELKVWSVPRPAPDRRELEGAAAALRQARRPIVIAGGGVHYSGAETTLSELATRTGMPVVETVAGKATLTCDHPNYAGPIGVTGTDEANDLVARADLVLAVGTRLQDFTTGSWTVFDPAATIIGCNAARFDAIKHRSLPLVADAAVALDLLDDHLADWQVHADWATTTQEVIAAARDAAPARVPQPAGDRASYAQVVRAVNQAADHDAYVVAAAGGLPGELNVHWQTTSVASVDCEYGFSCMGYEIAGAWGARMAHPGRQVIAFVGDGSWLMANSELYSTVLAGHKVIYVLCDNGGYAVIDRLQRAKGSPSFNNMLVDTRHVAEHRVDFVAHAAALGATAERVRGLPELPAAFRRAADADRSYVLVIETHADAWSDGGAWWEVGVPETSERADVIAARAEHQQAKGRQRRGL